MKVLPKYGNRKVTVDGVTFDSVKEYDRYFDLLLMERAGIISELKRQVKYLLIPSQFGFETDEHGRRKRVCIERECSYIADFVYKDSNGELVVEDVKGYRDPASAAYGKYVIKRKLMLSIFGIRVKEV